MAKHEYSFLRTTKLNHPFPRDACASSEFYYLQYLTYLALNNLSLNPRSVTIWRPFNPIKLQVVDKPKAFRATTSLVVNSTDQKYLGAIMTDKVPNRIIFGNARYITRYPPGIYASTHDYTQLKKDLSKLGLPYPDQAGVVLTLFSSLLELVKVQPDSEFKANISNFSQVYAMQFPQTTSTLWPVSNRDRHG